jgi:hypothetical protein
MKKYAITWTLGDNFVHLGSIEAFYGTKNQGYCRSFTNFGKDPLSMDKG